VNLGDGGDNDDDDDDDKSFSCSLFQTVKVFQVCSTATAVFSDGQIPITIWHLSRNLNRFGDLIRDIKI